MAKSEDETFAPYDDARSSSSNDEEGHGRVDTIHSRRRCRPPYVLYIVTILSIFLNVFQAFLIAVDSALLQKQRGSAHDQSHRTHVHESFRTISQPLYNKDLYEYTLSSNATDKIIGTFDPDHGVVALPAGQPHILPSKRFPWDASKEVFVLSSYHSLHSLQVLWDALHRATGSRPLSSHVLHSINMLWQDTICAASTVPMTINENLVNNQTAIREAGQLRQCRDWDVLEEFRVKHSACFKGMGGARKQNPMVEEWQNCPPGSPYQKAIDEFNAKLTNEGN